jgi:NADP-dependent 3-hydroxy acid dehydrogenase YdfG
MKSLQGKGIVITGAASGIGEALAHLCAQRGAKLLLADLNAERLHTLRTTLRGKGAEVSVMHVDVSERDTVEALAERARQLWGAADVLINNAGVAVVAPVESMREADARWLMDVNFWGAWYGCRAFLPQLKSRPAACVVNLSSIFAMVSMPTQSIYNASKAALRAFSDGLRQELADTNVTVLCVHPGGVKTRIAEDARVRDLHFVATDAPTMRRQFLAAARTTPAVAAEVILDAVRAGQPRVLVGADAKVLDAIFRLFPARASRWLTGLAKRQRAPAASAR